MKIRTLEIHNIASIEDATIDFDQNPLNNTDLFLITGTTGSGKTTILDAICLALYNTTPRIEKGSGGKENANRDNLTGKDPRNIMRSNTGFAYVKLLFTGNDGRDYLAEWSVQRGARKDPEQNMNNAVWSVTEIASGTRKEGDKRDAYTEVGEAIYAAVGLDFNQFCRTTMLAQGEFTEFLKSDEEAKAAILEKISGSGVYRKIGKEIYNQYIEAKRRFDEERRMHEAIEVMDAQVRQDKLDKIARLGAELEAQQKELDKVLKMIDWMNEMQTAESNVARRKAELETAENMVNTEEFMQKKALVDEWTETAETRESYRSALAELTRKEAAEAELERLEKQFGRALSGEAYMLAERLELAEQKHAAEAEIEAEKANAHAYKNEQSISGNIKNMADRLADVHKSQKELDDRVNTKRPEAEENALISTKKANGLKALVDETKLSLEELSKTIAELDLARLRAEKDLLSRIKISKSNIEVGQAKVAKAEESVEDLRAALPDAQKAAEHECKELERLREEHDRRCQSMEKLTLKMRSMLHEKLGSEDNFCPVCGQVVTSIKADEVFAEEYAKIKEEFEAQQTLAKAAEKSLSDLTSSITSEEKVLNGLRDELKGMLKELEDVQADDTMKACCVEKLAAMIDSVTGKITEGEKVEAKAVALQNRYAGLLKDYNEAQTKALEDSNALSLIDQDIKRLKDSIAADTQNAAAFRAKVCESLEGTVSWENDWNCSAEAFVAELRRKAGRYAQAESSLSMTESRLAGILPVITGIGRIKEIIAVCMPDWKAENVEAVNIPDIQDVWMKLGSNVQAQTQALKAAAESYETGMKVVADFLAAHDRYSIERLDALNKITPAAKNLIDKEIADLLSKKATAKAQYETALEQHGDLAGRKPEGITDETTVARLAAQKEAVTEVRDKMSEEKGMLMQEIAADDKALAKKGDTTLLDKLAAEHDKWKSFSARYGDKEGDTLNKIAQSFVLGSLLKTANHHLHGMAPRYKLLVNPGTLNLKLEDQQSCYATRSVNSISGGESFLVSLALALALADFGQHLGVSTLFIDEGFGTLSGEPLQRAINTLKAIHGDAGRQVGIISHREEIRENIPVQVRVNTIAGTSSSRVEVVG